MRNPPRLESIAARVNPAAASLARADAGATGDNELLALDEALERLEQADAEAAKLVKLRYFAGLTMTQTAEALGISLRSAERNWTYARAWLHRALSQGDADEAAPNSK